jgi:hypothetical protein
MTGIETLAATEFAGPSYDGGRIEIGRSADGRGQVVQIADGIGRTLHGLVVGDSGMGRTGVLEQVALGALASRAFRVLFANRDRGRARALDRFGMRADGRPAGAELQLAALTEFVNLRLWQRAQGAGRDFNPSPERPGVVWLVKGLNVELCADREFARRMQVLVEHGVKAGVSVWGITPGCELGADFGGFAQLRDGLAQRQVVLLPTTSRYSYTTPEGHKLDRRSAPYEPGYAALGTPHGVEALRTHHVRDAQRWVDAAEPVAWDDDARTVFARHGLDG